MKPLDLGLLLIAASLGVTSLSSLAHGGDTCSSGDSTYDTAVRWHDEPHAAFKEAQEDSRLVFLLHLSGVLPDPNKT